MEVHFFIANGNKKRQKSRRGNCLVLPHDSYGPAYRPTPPHSPNHLSFFSSEICKCWWGSRFIQKLQCERLQLTSCVERCEATTAFTRHVYKFYFNINRWAKLTHCFTGNYSRVNLGYNFSTQTSMPIYMGHYAPSLSRRQLRMY